MVEIDVEATRTKYNSELESFLARLQVLDRQRLELTRAIDERRGILAYLNTLDGHTPAE